MSHSANKKTFSWQLGIFPLLELALFILALNANSYLLSFVFIVFGGVLLSFSIHIFFHECVHFRAKYSQAVNLIYTLFLGLPFDGYRVHHYNHHSHANSLEDFSSTWYRDDNNKKMPFSACRYSFGWLRQLSSAIGEESPFNQELGDVTQIKARIGLQKITLYVFCIALIFIWFKAFVLYIALVYLGWFFSALHNYGQHPPIIEERICTYANKAYNVFFFNNGLHWEHHDKPWLSWNEIELDNKSERISHAHLIEPCFKRNKSKEYQNG